MPQWISAEAWLRAVAEREDVEATQLAAHQATTKPPWGERSMVARERTRKRNRAAEVHGRPIGDIATQGRT